MSMSREDLIAALRSAAIATEGLPLTYERFRARTAISMSAILRHFDTWREACKAACVESGSNGLENIKPNYSKGRVHALEQLRKAAANIKATRLSKSQFNAQNPEVRAATVARMFGGWEVALNAAWLLRNVHYRDRIPIDDLAQDFLITFRVCLGRVGKSML